MTHKQLRPASGRKRRLAPATPASAGEPAAIDRLNPRARSRFRLFAQFPPQSLFAAINRAASRAFADPRVASGTELASCRRRRAAGGG